MIKQNRAPLQWILSGLALSLLLGLLLLPLGGIAAQDGPAPTQPAGTRVPPTKVPAPVTPTPAQTTSLSGIATLQETGVLHVGTTYNTPPFSWLDESGEVVGYEADVVRAVATDMGVDVEFFQVTAETAEAMLLSGEVDVLIGQQVHTRQAEATREFSHIIFTNFQRVVVRQDAPYGAISDLTGQPVSVVVGSQAEAALNAYAAGNSLNLEIRRYLTPAEALDALENGEVEAMAGEFDDLRRAGRQGMRFLDESLRVDPYAIALRRYDINLRNAINRALQRLAASGRMDEIASTWFDEQERATGTNFAALIPVYQGFADDVRAIDDFPPDIPQPERSVLDKIRAGEQLVVAGLSMNEADASYKRFLDPLHQAIMREMARRWGVSVIFMPETYGQGPDNIVTGEADLAIGVYPRWDGADRVDYSLPYHHRSDKIITYEGSRFRHFTDFRGGTWLGYFSDDPADEERIQELAEIFNTRLSIYTFISNQQAYDEMIGTRNVDGLFGDSIRLQAFIINNDPDLWRFIENPRGGEFSDGFSPITLAVPRNDRDFLTLVNWTLGDMYSDGTLQRLWEEHYPGFGQPGFSGGPSYIPDWPGDGGFLYEMIEQ